MNERESLMHKINGVDFAMWELKIFLDTHPDDQEALRLRDKYAKKRDVLVADYEKNFGPLNMNSVTDGTRWKWISDPWPWDYQAEAEDHVGL